MSEKKGRYILEFVRIGKTVKITACDPETGVEVSTIGPSTASKSELTSAALAKLRYMLDKDILQ